MRDFAQSVRTKEVGDIKIRRLLLTLAAFALLTLFSSCFCITTDDLYSLPEASDEYVNLQAKLNEIINTGAEYLPPESGPNRQSVQLKDIDGDGINEAIVFFYAPWVDKPLKIHIYKNVQGDYELADVIEGNGAAIDSVRYLDMDGDGVLELAVGWKMSPSLKHMALYSMKGFEHIQIADADYSALASGDLHGNNKNNLIVISLPSADTPGQLQVISMMDDGEVVKNSAELPNDVASVSNLVTGFMADSAPAIFLDCKDADGFMSTYMYPCTADGLKNITADLGEASSVRERTASMDINKDGVVEIPFPRALPQQSDTTYYVIDWYAFDSVGNHGLTLTTYHNYTDGWYLILPDNWYDQVSIRREASVSGERSIIFSFIVSGNSDVTHYDFLKVYALSGAGREDRSKLPGRFVLSSDSDTIYVAELRAQANSFGITFSQQYVQTNFGIIYSDWMSGVM